MNPMIGEETGDGSARMKMVGDGGLEPPTSRV